MSAPATANRRLGLFGGSFDPIHGGHLYVARAAQRAHQLDRVIFVPAARPPHKPGRELASGPHRLAMVELAIAAEASWSACDLELYRPGPSYTIDTVLELPARVGEADDVELFLILGSDNLPGLPSWWRVDELLERVHPIVVPRGAQSASTAGESTGAGPWPRSVSDEAVPGEADGAQEPDHDALEMPVGLPAKWRAKLARGILDVPTAPGRSTDLRAALAAGEVPRDLPVEVLDYIREHGLYFAS